jgi:hypothetical protein
MYLLRKLGSPARCTREANVGADGLVLVAGATVLSCLGRYCGAVALTSAVVGLSACGGGVEENPVVVRVGANTITKSTVDRWTDVVRRDGAFTGFRGAPRGGPARERALALLISSEWLIGEAAREGLPVAAASVDRVVAERAQGIGQGEFHRHLATTGQTPAGVKLEIAAELALEAIDEQLSGRAEQITAREVAKYYRENVRMFGTPEVSVTDIIENLPSKTAATALVKRIGGGRRFAQLAYRKKVAHTSGVLSGPADKKRVDYAIFAARPGVVSEPMKLEGHWTVFVVRSIIPPKPEPYSKVYAAVLTSLKATRQRQLKAQFDTQYTSRWRSKTTCSPGYVAPGCPQYTAPLGPYEDPFSARAHPALAEG